ncbi:MAG: sugar phosphate nucleotidyltransferase [Balneolales bacterium]
MKLVIPMAGRGTRLRPHSLTTPKPLLPVAGPMLIERIIQSFVESIDKKIVEIAFILGDFGKDVEHRLSHVAKKFGAKPVIYYQMEALGTAHAVNCAAASLSGEVIIAFADTLFEIDGRLDLENAESLIWLKQVKDPSQFGVAVIEDGRITRFIEKPKEPVSDMAIIGVYYFREGERLQNELQYLMDNNIRGHKNEFDLTDAIDRLLNQGLLFQAANVQEWLDFGTIPAWLQSTAAVLNRSVSQVPDKEDSVRYHDTKIIQPCYLGKNSHISNSIIGPYACIGDGCSISDSTVSRSIIRNHATVNHSKLVNSTVGETAEVYDCSQEIHIGDCSRIGNSDKI